MALYNRYIPPGPPPAPPKPPPPLPGRPGGGVLDLFSNLRLERSDLILLLLLALLCLEDGEEPGDLLILAAAFLLGG